MESLIRISEKFEYNGWPSMPRPDITPPEGWNLPLVTAQERVRNHRLSPDGSQSAFIRDTGGYSDVYCISAGATGWPARVSTNRDLVAYWDDEIPQWSPNGRLLAFTVRGQVHIARSDGGIPRCITDFISGASSPRWMPDANSLIISVCRDDADQLLLTSKDGRWSRQLTHSSAGDHWDAQPSPDGNSVVFTFRRFDDLHRLDICLIDLQSGEIRTVYGQPGVRTRDPRWSPDGKWISFISQADGNDDLWLVRADGEQLQRVIHLGYDIGQYVWQPGLPTNNDALPGGQILLTINRGGAYDLAVLELPGGTLHELRACNGVHANPNWSPDGSFITFEYESPLAPPEIFRMELANNKITQLTFSMLPALAANKMVLPERVSFRSQDGLEIPAFLYQPASAGRRSNGAAILHPHGGPSAQYALEWDINAQYLAAKGYTFLALNYRGSTGYGVQFEHANYGDWGMGDTQDCLAGARYLQRLPGLDKKRLAIMGGSYGGYLANCCLARDPDYLFACGISKYGDANTLSSWALCKRELRLYTEIFLGHPSINSDAYRQSSPIYQVSDVQKPLLLLHGLEDDTVPPQASEEWAQALRAHGKTFEYKTYPGEPHGFLRQETQLDALTRIERFLDWYLLT